MPAPLAAPDISEIPLLQDAEASGVLLDDLDVDGKEIKEAAEAHQSLVSSEESMQHAALLPPIEGSEGKWRTQLKTQRVQFDLD